MNLLGRTPAGAEDATANGEAVGGDDGSGWRAATDRRRVARRCRQAGRCPLLRLARRPLRGLCLFAPRTLGRADRRRYPRALRALGRPAVSGRAARSRGPAGARAGPLLGQRIEVDVGPVAHGGHCVARHDGRVVFVRHALPGERVTVEVTEDRGGGYCRGDAVGVLRASPDRVEPPCPHAGPGRCGGCDWQHASATAQRRLKAAVLVEQFARLAGLPGLDVVVEPLPAGEHGGLLGWRTRARFAVGPDGRAGLRRHRSHQLEVVRRCPLTTDEVDRVGVTRRRWPGAVEVEVVCSSGGDRGVTVVPTAPGPGALGGRGPTAVRERAIGREWLVAATGFWQVHPAAADTLAGAVADLLAVAAGETGLDLYAGAGLFAGVLAEAVTARGRVIAVEADATAAAHAAANLADLPQVQVRTDRVSPSLLGDLHVRPDVVVLDPPRTGAGAEVMAALLGLGPRAVAYVACDPAALARDVRAARQAGYRLSTLRAYDLFPMTHHLECIALLVRE